MKSSLVVGLAAFVLVSCGPVSPPVATEPVATEVVVQAITSKDLPSFSWQPASSYKVDPFMEAASKLQALGKDKAVQVLREAIAHRSAPGDTIIILCRMLFVAKPGGSFRKPALGAPSLIGSSDNFPLEPVELAEGVPFLVVKGYVLAGQAEPVESYLNYCLSECEWSSFKYSPKTAAQKTQALEKLMWKHPLSPGDMSFVTTQIE